MRSDDKPNITQIGKNHGVMWKTVNDVRNDHKKYSEYFEKYNSEIKAFSQMYCDKPKVEKTVRSAKRRVDNNWKK